MLHTGMLKGFNGWIARRAYGGALGAVCRRSEEFGLPRYEAAKLNDMAKERVFGGLPAGIHAIGDKGVQMALDAFAEAEKAAHEQKVKAANGGDDFRLRIEHAQVTTPAQVARFKELKVIASMQPAMCLTDMRWAQDRLGPKRAATAYAWLAFLNKGVDAGFWDGLSSRAGNALSRVVCGGHAPEREREAGVLSGAKADHGAGHWRLTPRVRHLPSSKRKKKAAGAGDARGLRGA